MTGQTLINSALRLIGVLATGENPSTAESNDALATLNDMLDSWNAQNLTIFSDIPQTFPLVSGQQSYQMGPGAPDFNVARPAKITGVSILTQQSTPALLELPIKYITVGEWQQIPLKSIASLLPMECWDTQGFPWRTLNYWPIPNEASVSTIIYSWVPLASFANLVTTYSFPPGYAEAIRFNLAVRLAPEFGVMQVSPVVTQTAFNSLQVLKVMNSDIRTEPMYCDPAMVSPEGRIFDWRTGGFLHGGLT